MSFILHRNEIVVPGTLHNKHLEIGAEFRYYSYGIYSKKTEEDEWICDTGEYGGWTIEEIENTPLLKLVPRRICSNFSKLSDGEIGVLIDTHNQVLLKVQVISDFFIEDEKMKSLNHTSKGYIHFKTLDKLTGFEILEQLVKDTRKDFRRGYTLLSFPSRPEDNELEEFVEDILR